MMKLSAARAGEERAAEALYHQLAPAVLGYLKGQGAREPEDLLSDVFVAVVRGLPRFRGDDTALRSWVFSIAHRRLQDERRRLARRPLDLVDPARIVDLQAGHGDAEQEAVERLDTAAMLEGLRDLTAEQRDVVLLRCIADLPIDDVARLVGKRPGAVKALQHRAMRALGKTIERTKPVSSGPVAAITGAT